MHRGPPRIYVQVPAYRDPQLVPTLRDLLDTAARPEQLVVAVAWQHGPDEACSADELRRLSTHLLDLPATGSQGCNWARELLQRRWDGEEYTLFLDSHHRFVPGWDDALLDLHRQLQEDGVERPLLSGYLPPFDPADDPSGWVRAVYRMDLAERRNGLMYRLTGHVVPGWDRLPRPTAAAFVSLHLLFVEGRFNEVVPMDPGIYFFADEVAVALRAFTHGYDLFHPHVVLGWHLYDRGSRTTHWADHADGRTRTAQSLERIRSLYAGADLGSYGLGGLRTRHDYERLVGRRLCDEDRHGSHNLEEVS